jgi:hypothetical protein
MSKSENISADEHALGCCSPITAKQAATNKPKRHIIIKTHTQVQVEEEEISLKEKRCQSNQAHTHTYKDTPKKIGRNKHAQHHTNAHPHFRCECVRSSVQKHAQRHTHTHTQTNDDPAKMCHNHLIRACVCVCVYICGVVRKIPVVGGRAVWGAYVYLWCVCGSGQIRAFLLIFSNNSPTHFVWECVCMCVCTWAGVNMFFLVVVCVFFVSFVDSRLQ